MHLRNILSINNLTNVITEPTRETQNSSTLYDPIIVSDGFDIHNTSCCEVDNVISDHKATYIYIKFELINQPCTTKRVWYYKRGDFIHLNE